MKIIKSLTNCYNKLSNFGKILVFIALLLVVVIFFRSFETTKEGMMSKSSFDVDSEKGNFLFKQGNAVYDDFYADIYDYLVFNRIKNDYEVGVIVNSSNPTEKSIIADIGSGTGHQVADLSSKNLQVIGIDISPSMVQKAKQNYPPLSNNFKVGDGLDGTLFRDNSLTHILCLYFTIYYIKDKMRFFYNCMNWLMPGGYLIVHLVDKYKFDPILPPGNPLYIVSPQKYAKERITKTKVTFNEFVYDSNFKLDDNDVATFDEKFKFNDGKVRKQEQTLYMEDLPTIVNMAQEAGFLIHAKVDMVKCAYEYQYLYVFVKPN
jgi:SAM-dependent methyltransferase